MAMLLVLRGALEEVVPCMAHGLERTTEEAPTAAPAVLTAWAVHSDTHTHASGASFYMSLRTLSM